MQKKSDYVHYRTSLIVSGKKITFFGLFYRGLVTQLSHGTKLNKAYVIFYERLQIALGPN